MMSLIFMTLLLTLAAGTLAASEFQLKTSVVAKSVEAGYYTSESIAQIALDLLLDSVDPEDDDDDKIPLYLEETVVFDDYDNPPDFEIDIDENDLVEQIQDAFDRRVRQRIEAIEIDGKNPVVGELEIGGEFLPLDDDEEGIIYQDEETDEFVYSSGIRLEGANFSFPVVFGAHEITVRTKADVTVTGRIDYVPPSGGETGGFVQNGSVVGGLALVGGFNEWNITNTRPYVTSSGNTMAAWVESIIAEVEARTDLTSSQKEDRIKELVYEMIDSVKDAVRRFGQEVAKLITEWDTKPESAIITESYPNIYEGTSAYLSVSNTQLAGRTLTSYKEIRITRASGTVTVLDGSRCPNLEYLYINDWTNIELKGDFNKLKYISTGGVLTFSDDSDHNALEFIRIRNNVTGHIIAGDFKALKGIYSPGDLVLGHQSSASPFTTTGDNKPRIWVANFIKIYLFGGKTTQILNAEIFSKTTSTEFVTHDTRRTKHAKFSSNAVFISPRSFVIPLGYVDWDETRAPQFYSQNKLEFKNELNSGDTCVIRGIFVIGNNQVLDSPITFELQGFVVSDHLGSGSPINITGLEENQLSNVPPGIMAILDEFSDVIGEGDRSGEPAVPAVPGDPGIFVARTGQLDLRETTGGNP